MRTTAASLARGALLVVLGAVAGSVSRSLAQPATPPAPLPERAAGQESLEALRAEVAHLRELTPSQSHSMADVGYQFANLWFAGQAKSWDLAAFYLDETRSHIRWTIRIRPIRKDPSGSPVDLAGIFDGIENGVFSRVKEAIARKDGVAFTAAYRLSLEACYSCHKASGKPYLRPMIPRTPPQPIITFDPKATWPR